MCLPSSQSQSQSLSLSQSPTVSISVVSHGHGPHILRLLADLARLAAPDVLEVILTLNVPEADEPVWPVLPVPLRVIRNAAPRGFGANHNAAFKHAVGTVFAILNPDLELPTDPFPALLAALGEPGVALVAPRVCDETGQIAPSARRFYTPWEIASRCWRVRADVDRPDWLAGMFLAIHRADFAALGGFDEGYFLYIEDVDLSTRLRVRGRRLRLVPEVSVVHAAQYASHRSWQHLKWHLASMARYWTSAGFWRLGWRKLCAAGGSGAGG